MQILIILPILMTTIFLVYGDEKIPLQESQFVSVIFHHNSVRNDVNKIKLHCLGALVSNYAVVTSSNCRPDSIENLGVAIFNWTKPGDLKSKFVTAKLVGREHVWTSNNQDSLASGLKIYELFRPLDITQFKPINLPQAKDNYSPEQFTRLHLDRQKNVSSLRQDDAAKVDLTQCSRAIEMEKYKPSAVSCFNNIEPITTANITECMGETGNLIVYGRKDDTTDKIKFYLYGLMYEANQCMFVYSNFDEEMLEWLKNTIDTFGKTN